MQRRRAHSFEILSEALKRCNADIKPGELLLDNSDDSLLLFARSDSNRRSLEILTLQARNGR
jgi:hypothetical protein